MLPNIHVDQTFNLTLEMTDDVIDSFAKLSGDINPLHMSDEYARSLGYPSRIAHGGILALMVSTLVGMKLPSQDVMLLSSSLNFRSPVYVGTIIRLVGSVNSVSEATSTFEMSLRFVDSKEKQIATGKCLVRWTR